MSSATPLPSASVGNPLSRRLNHRSVRRRSVRKPKGDDDEIDVPSKFGNAADYWKHFNDVASVRNKELMDSLNQNLDLLLVFCALFAGVNSGFLAFAVPMLSADPAAETNHLLRLLVRGGTNQTGLTDEDLKAPEFTASGEAIHLARLFSASLTLTVLTAFGAMVAKQWMIYYARGSQEGPSERESRMLQKKVSGVHRCGLRFLTELALPSLVQVSLIVFSVGVISYLETISHEVAWVNAVLAWIGLGVFGITVIYAVWDPYCPFQTPISQFLWFIICLPFDMIPGIVLALVKRFPKKIIKKATGGLFQYLVDGWRQPLKTAKAEKEIITKTVDSSYIRTLTHRLKFAPFSDVVSRIQRPEDPTDVIDAHYSCHILRRLDQPELLQATARSIPTLFDRKAMSTLLKDKAIVRLHQLFRGSIAQAEGAADALVQGSDDKSNPSVNAVIYGRAIIHLFVALGPHDDWFWDDYETALHHGWLEPWTLEGVDGKDVPDKVIVELEQQRLLIQACLSIGPDENAPSVQVDDSALPLYIAASIKALLHRRVHHHICHYLPKIGPIVETWTGEAHLERMAFCTVFPEHYPKAIGLVAWALATVPHRVYEPDMLILDKYNMFWSDYKEIWDAYSSTSNILRNVAKALNAFIPHPSDDESHSSPTEIKKIEIKEAYRAMLEATRLYIKERAAKEDVLAIGPELVHAIGDLKAKMDVVPSLSDEDEEIRGTLQPIVEAIVVRRGKRLRQHARSVSGLSVENKPTSLLENRWFSGNVPAVLEEYSEWITTQPSSSPDLENRDFFLKTWNEERPKEREIDMTAPEASEKPRI